MKGPGWQAKIRSGMTKNLDGKIAAGVGGVGGGAAGASVGGIGVAAGGTAFGIPVVGVVIVGAILGAWLTPKGYRFVKRVFGNERGIRRSIRDEEAKGETK